MSSRTDSCQNGSSASSCRTPASSARKAKRMPLAAIQRLPVRSGPMAGVSFEIPVSSMETRGRDAHAPWNAVDFFHGPAFALRPVAGRRKFLRTKRIMTQESQAIEVEVVEIDGAAPPAKVDRQEQAPRQWRTWQGRIRTLDSRWWPLWVLLGAIGVVLLLTVGLVLGIVMVIFRILSAILRAVFG